MARCPSPPPRHPREGAPGTSNEPARPREMPAQPAQRARSTRRVHPIDVRDEFQRDARAGRPRREKLSPGCQLGRRAGATRAGIHRQRPTRHRHERSAVAPRTPVTVPHTAGARRIDPARSSSPQPARSPTAAAQLGYWGLQASRHACTCGKKRCAVTTVSAAAAPSPATVSARREPTLARRLLSGQTVSRHGQSPRDTPYFPQCKHGVR